MLKQNENLDRHTSFLMGGPAKLFAEPNTEKEFISILKSNTEKLLILGEGTNIIISENGFDGLVVKPIYKYLNKLENHLWEVSAGYHFDDFVLETVKDNLYGVECLSGIPGNIGSSPIQNIGAYGQEVSGTIYKVKCFNLKTKQIEIFTNEQCKFEYRSSAFKSGDLKNLVILSVTFRLSPTPKSQITHTEILDEISNRDSSLKSIREIVLDIRNKKGMLLNSENKTVGSFFTNPIVNISTLKNLPSDIPYWNIKDNKVKLSAAWLIENSGFKKGQKLGRIGISEKHTLALINLGNATDKDILDAVLNVKHIVFDKFKVNIMPEPTFIGFNEKVTRKLYL